MTERAPLDMRMLRTPLVRNFAGGEARPQRGLVPRQVAPDEHGLRLRAIRQLEPADLVPAAGEVEEPLPLAVGKPDQALCPQHVRRQAVQEPLEAILAERPAAAVDEACDAVVVAMGRTARPRGTLPIGGDSGREEQIAFQGAAYRAEPLRPARVGAAWIKTHC